MTIHNIQPSDVALAVKSIKKARLIPGAAPSTEIKRIQPKEAEFLVYSNSFVRRGVEKTAEALVRNGYSITPENSGDEETIQQFVSNNKLTSTIINMTRNACIYGDNFNELAADKDLGFIIPTLPPGEIDFQRDSSKNIIYKNGKPKGYNQIRNNEVIAEWNEDQIAHLKFIEYGAVDLGISMLQPLVQPCLEYGMTRSNLADGYIRSLNVVHVKAAGATREELEDISGEMDTRFTAQTAYVTSDRIDMGVVNSNSAQVNPQFFMEPTLAEVAAAFDMPIELIAATSTLDGKDFDKRKLEWLEHIRLMQDRVAELFETKIFPAFIDEPVTMTFNSPQTIDIKDLVTAIGFAVQSKAMTEEKAQNIIDNHPAFKILQIQ